MWILGRKITSNNHIDTNQIIISYLTKEEPTKIGFKTSTLRKLLSKTVILFEIIEGFARYSLMSSRY